MVAPIETQLRLEKFEENLFRSTEVLWRPKNARGVFGGVVIAQSLMAAVKTVDQKFHVHSMHCYFVTAGDNKIPIVYQVERVRDGRSFVTRTVKAIQKGKCIFTTSISFMVPPPAGQKTVHHQSLYPGVPTPREIQASYNPHRGPQKTKGGANDKKRESREDELSSPPPANPLSSKKGEETEEVENGMDVRFIPPSENYEFQTPSQRRTRHWIRATGEIEDPKAHIMALAYMSDSFLLGTSLIANKVPFRDVSMMVSLDHAIYFHEQPKADEWLVHCVETPWTGNDRGLVIGRFFTQDGTHVATVVQEGLIRLSPEVQAKL